jgi:hypothetical protein
MLLLEDQWAQGLVFPALLASQQITKKKITFEGVLTKPTR